MLLFEVILNNPNFLEPTPENISKAKVFVLKKWQERAKENNKNIPNDLSAACKFSSLFASIIFGGKIKGNFFHQWVELPNKKIFDLNDEAEDIALMKQGEIPDYLKDYANSNNLTMPKNIYTHDIVQQNHPDNKLSMKSIKPRVMSWVEEFKRENGYG